ncbi:hypothetical protein [Planococcus ruber]|uniref:hypothetical protein n=1 Tax=Planococcus ruber TaxID=2027871 RepID=UPI001FEF619F|nr:hypothetical protein [Planococcus ruber]MCJ1908557.1 hypothetical protein [Planococcus ruber]
MAKVSLAEAVKLKSILAKRIHELEEEMVRVSFAEIEKGGSLPKQARSIADAEYDLENVRKDFRTLDKLMYEANISHVIEFNGEALTIVEAIEYATQLRAKARLYKVFGASKKEEFPYNFGEAAALIRVALFDPEEYRLKALDIERQANRLSNAINAKNYTIALNFDGSTYF